VKCLKPLVTVAIPTRNRANYLREAIRSVLSQTYTALEVIVSDNASADNTQEVVNGFSDPRIRYFRHETGLEMVSNWNYCLEQATGEFFLLLSDDDALESDAITWFVEQFTDSRVALAYSRIVNIDSDSRSSTMSPQSPATESGASFIANALMRRRVSPPSATLYRTDIARKLGGYPPVGTAIDVALGLSIAIGGIVRFCPRPLVQYRVHSEAVSRQAEKVALSHRAFMDWSSCPESPLYEYRELVRRHCKNVVLYLAVSSALKGDRCSAISAMELLRGMGSKWWQEALVRISFIKPLQMPLRLAMTIRRRVLYSLLRRV